MNDRAPTNPLISLLELAQRARAAASGNELAFLAVNDTRALAPYRQAALWFHGSGVHTLSGVVAVESNAPYAQWLDQLCRTLAEQHSADTPLAVDPAQLPAAIKAEWDDWLPASAVWLPLRALAGPSDQSRAGAQASADSHAMSGKRSPTDDHAMSGKHSPSGDQATSGARSPADRHAAAGGLLLAGDAALAPNQLALLGEWMDIWQHAWRAAHPPPRWSLARTPSRLRDWWHGGAQHQRWRRRAGVALALLAVLLFPVRLTVLAPGELVPANPATIRAPLDGVIADFAVRPNQVVAAGQPLFSFDQAPIGSRLDVAREALSTAQAEYRQNAQLMLNDPRVRTQLAGTLGKVAEKQAQADFLEGQAQRSRVLAPQAGIVLFDDPSEWIGRPVQTGERIMQVAAADDVEIEAWLPIGDAIPLADNAPLQLYLASSPLTPLAGTLRYMSHRATARPDGSYAYRVRARLDAPAGQRIGLKGTAKLGGERVPLIYWVMRRPLASIRQFIAL